MLEMYALQSVGGNLAAFPVQHFRDLFASISQDENMRDFILADNQFHAAILAISPNQRLPRLYAYLQNLIQIISVQAIKTEGRIVRANDEHLALLDAIASQDVELAISRLKMHFSEMRSALLLSLSIN